LQVGPDFFRAKQIPLLAGRVFNAFDYELAAKRPAPPNVPTPVVVSQVFVGKYLGAENPLGKRFGESAGSVDEPPSAGYEIIGVARDSKFSDLRREVGPMMYAPLSGFAASFEVRTAASPEQLVPTIRQVVAQLDPNLPLRDVSTQTQQIDRLLFQERLVARVSSFFGALALVLACVGLYGLLAYEVARRTREIGIRMAIGAEARNVLTMVVKQGLALALLGAAIGVAVAMGVMRYLKSMLFEVRAYDPTIIVAVAALLLLVALAACVIPARRATTVDPMVALRSE
jgi:predicted permease